MKKEVFSLSFIAAIAFLSVGIITFNFDPFNSAQNIKILFYASLFTAIWSGGTILLVYLRKENENRFSGAFRLGLLLSVVILAIFLGLRFR